VIEELQAVLDAGTPLGILLKSSLPSCFGRKTEGQLVGRNYLEMICYKAVPELRLIFSFAQGGVNTYFASSKLLPGIWSSMERRRYCGQVSAKLERRDRGFADLIEGIFARQVTM